MTASHMLPDLGAARSIGRIGLSAVIGANAASHRMPPWYPYACPTKEDNATFFVLFKQFFWDVWSILNELQVFLPFVSDASIGAFNTPTLLNV